MQEINSESFFHAISASPSIDDMDDHYADDDLMDAVDNIIAGGRC